MQWFHFTVNLKLHVPYLRSNGNTEEESNPNMRTISGFKRKMPQTSLYSKNRLIILRVL